MRRQYIKLPLRDRFLPKIERLPSGCWRWTGFVDKAGYGRIRDDRGRAGSSLYAHRVAYELFVGPIPEGTELDHLCHNRWCCNPEHLEPVPHQINVQRGEAPTMRLHRAGTCRNGHPVNEQNTVFRRGTSRVAYCKVCRREKRAEQRNQRTRVYADGH